MDKSKEIEFINQLGLQNLQRFAKGFNCTCPFCCSNTPWKRKLYILTEGKPYITVYCQKCGLSTNLKKFIEMTNLPLYKEYINVEKIELIKSLKNGIFLKKEKIESNLNTHIQLKYKFNLNKKYFKPAKNFKEAVEFCKKRKIIEHIDKLYFNIHPNHKLSGMVIFPFLLNDQKTLYGFQGRHYSEKRFYTFSSNDSMKVYNLYNIDFEKPVYIFESIIDSMMVENSIAMLGTSLAKVISDLIPQKIYIFDNDKTGKNRTLEFLKNGEKCLIYPENFKFKDFNEAVCSGVSKQSLKFFINDNVYQGLEGITKLKFQLMKLKR